MRDPAHYSQILEAKHVILLSKMVKPQQIIFQSFEQ